MGSRPALNFLTIVLLCYIAAADWKTMEIPDVPLFLLAGCGVAAVFVSPEIGLMERGLGFLCVSLPMALLCQVIEDAFGGGDIRLSAVMGFYLGWRACLVGIMIGIFIGGIQALLLLASGKVRYGEGAHMAFGPALCAGFALAELYGIQIFEWYVGVLTMV